MPRIFPAKAERKFSRCRTTAFDMTVFLVAALLLVRCGCTRVASQRAEELACKVNLSPECTQYMFSEFDTTSMPPEQEISAFLDF